MDNKDLGTLLYDNKWVQVYRKNTFVYTHEKWCNSIGVAILPYRFLQETVETLNEPFKQIKRVQFLGRYEKFTLSEIGKSLVSLTGGYDEPNKYSIQECVLKELKEEAGYIAGIEDLLPLGTAMPSKSSDKVYHLFGIDLSKATKRIKPTGDGTALEDSAYCEWVTSTQIISSLDPLLHTMMIRLNQYHDIPFFI